MQIQHDPQRKKNSQNIASSRRGSSDSSAEKSSKFHQVISIQAGQIREEVQVLMNQVDQASQALIQDPSERQLIHFTTAVRSFLRKAQGQSLSVDKNFDKHNRLSILVREVDSKLAQLTEEIMNNQAKSIHLAARIQEIRGILLDMYI